MYLSFIFLLCCLLSGHRQFINRRRFVEPINVLMGYDSTYLNPELIRHLLRTFVLGLLVICLHPNTLLIKTSIRYGGMFLIFSIFHNSYFLTLSKPFTNRIYRFHLHGRSVSHPRNQQ
jgi:hypothetical protein